MGQVNPPAVWAAKPPGTRQSDADAAHLSANPAKRAPDVALQNRISPPVASARREERGSPHALPRQISDLSGAPRCEGER
jgi:hypothetical protein